MDPLLDEKIVLTISRTIPEFFESNLGMQAKREAYGPSLNEGLCYEKCAAIDMSGEFSGTFFIGMDGYSKMKILPYIARAFHLTSFRQISSSLVLMEFTNQICGQIANDLQSAGFDLEISVPRSLDNKLVAFNRREIRQYILIFFLRDPERKKYLGRLYAVLTLKKFDPGYVDQLKESPAVVLDYSEDSRSDPAEFDSPPPTGE